MDSPSFGTLTSPCFTAVWQELVGFRSSTQPTNCFTGVLQELVGFRSSTQPTNFGDSGCFLSPVMERNWRYRVFLKAFGVSRRELAAEGDRVVCRNLSEGAMQSCQVDAAVVLAFDGVVDDAGSIDRARTPLYLPNEFVARMAREHPGLWFGASVNPG